MKCILFLLLFFPWLSFSQSGYERNFTTGSMRVDFLLAGNSGKTTVYLQALKKEPFWGGSGKNLVDTMKYGTYRFTVSDTQSGEILFSNGFCTLFNEWQTTDEARITDRSFSETVVFPFPKRAVKFDMLLRGKNGFYSNIFSTIIDPSDVFIQSVSAGKYPVTEILESGPPSECVDIAFIPDGYTRKDMKKFADDVKRLTDSLFTIEPYRTYKNRFNIHAVMAPSEEQGTDIPGEGIWRETVANSTFYTFNIERYLSTGDYWKLRDLASNVPYDQICLLVNTDKYGGGGIYNHYNITAAGNQYAAIVFVHEFAHSFAGVGDEYYTSEVSYQNFYPLDVEPWEPNLTTLVNFERKWKSLISPEIPIPTPASDEYRNKVGLFEGGGYMAKGIYRPQINCIMLSMKDKTFCRVCNLSAEKVIKWLSK